MYSFNDQQTNLGPNDDTSPQSHGPVNRGVVNINFFDTATSVNTTDPAEVSVTVASRLFELPKIDTYYHCQAFKIDWGQQKRHIVRAEPSINFTNRGVVHHILFMACPNVLTDGDLSYAGACYPTQTPGGLLPGMPQNLKNCDQVSLLAGWAVGGGPVVFPPEAGYPVQGVGYYLMQIHYNNPTLAPVADSTRYVFRVTPNLRKYDSACLEFARVIPSIVIPPGNSSYVVESYVDQQAFQLAQSVGGIVSPIYIFASFLHSHLLGRKIRVSQFRTGSYVGDIDYNPGYDFNYQQTVLFDTPRVFYSSDTMKLQCFYDSSEKTTPTYGGDATENEMCQVYLYYYPATANPLTTVASYPAVLTPPYTMRTDGEFDTFVEYGMLHLGNSSTAGTYHLTTPPTILPTCTTTHSTPYSGGTSGTNYLPISEFDPNFYPNSMILDAEGKYKLYWKVTMDSNGGNGIISLAAEVETGGWLGFGISPSGNMIGSDVIIGWVNTTTKTVSILDRKATQHAQPQIDKSQDVFNVYGFKGLYPKVNFTGNPLYYYP